MATAARSYLECYPCRRSTRSTTEIDALPRGSNASVRCATSCPRSSFRPRSINGPFGLPAKPAQQIDSRNTNQSFIAPGDTFQIWKPEPTRPEDKGPRRGMAGRVCQKTLIRVASWNRTPEGLIDMTDATTPFAPILQGSAAPPCCAVAPVSGRCWMALGAGGYTAGC